MNKILIIGASCAGYNCAKRLAVAHDLNAHITVVTEEPDFFYDRRKIPEFIMGAVKEKDMLLESEEIRKNPQVECLAEKKVSTISFERKTVYFKERGTCDFDILVIASGRRVEVPEIPGIKKDGVYRLYSLKDTKLFLNRFVNDALCVQAQSEFGFQLARSLAQKFKVEIKVIGQPAHLSADGIECIPGTIVSVIGEGGVQAVKLDNGKAIGVSYCLFADVTKNNIEFLKNSALTLAGDSIIVNESGQTSIPGVYACGVVAHISSVAENNLKTWDACAQEGTRVAEHIIQTLQAPVISQEAASQGEETHV